MFPQMNLSWQGLRIVWILIYIFVGLILMFWHRETHITHNTTDKLSCTKRASNSVPPGEGKPTAAAVHHVRFMAQKLCQKHNAYGVIEAALDNWQPFWNAKVLISTTVWVDFELLPGSGDIHICWFNFDAPAQWCVGQRRAMCYEV